MCFWLSNRPHIDVLFVSLMDLFVCRGLYGEDELAAKAGGQELLATAQVQKEFARVCLLEGFSRIVFHT